MVKVCSLVAELLAHHHMLVTTVDELWYRVEAAWASVPVPVIQSLFDSMPRRINGEVVVLSTDFSESMHQNFLKF
ncbi:hypothetical protein TNCV_535611 [Trichonephila clavipes]|nr:hypothetical protein TNCV_535611 [Trichonephila clavipes]